jgi:cellulose synthase/poly-beta-1,6-N-acetylglucosamine synthase-like glycosyltransferase
MTLAFWLVSGVLLYTYIGYPVLIAALAALWPRKIVRTAVSPRVSLLIAAHNEERFIAAKVKNCLSLEYPCDQLEIVVGSDGSTDATAEMVEACLDDRVRLVRFDVRRGKISLLNDLIPSLAGEIVVLSDARQTYALDAVRELVKNFADPTVGAVGGELHLIDDAHSTVGSGLGLYWLYEKWMRRSESVFQSTVGGTGAIYALRKSLFQPIPADTLLDDVVIPMNVVRQGFRMVFDSRAVAFDEVSRSGRQEFVRKVRTITGNFQLFARSPWILNPIQNPIWFQTVSHKGMRLIAPLGMLSLLGLNVMLAPGSWFYSSVLGAQLAFYLLAMVGFILERAGRGNRAVSACYVFCLLNATTLVSFYRFVTGSQRAAWERSA